jgi:tetratricopeptide (TPR) repeat protein
MGYCIRFQFCLPIPRWAIFLAGLFLLPAISGRAQTRPASARLSDLSERNWSPKGQRPDSLFLTAKQQYAQATEREDELGAAQALSEMGRICYHLGQYPQSLDYHLQANRLFRRLDQPALLAESLNDLGQLYYYSRQPELAQQQYQEALKLYQKAGNRVGLAVTYGNIGHLYEKQSQYDSAFYFQRQALAQYQQAADQTGLAKIYENLGSIFEDLAQYDSARYYFEQSLLQNQQTSDEAGRVEILNNLGDVLRKTGHYREGLAMSKQALALAIKTGERYQLSGACNDIGKSFNFLNQNDSAYYYAALSRRYQAEIYSEEVNQQLSLLQTLYDTERKNSEINRLTNDRNVQLITTAALSAVGILLAVLAALVISRQRLKIRTERELREQNQRVYETQHELMRAELKNKKLEEENLKHALEIRSRELTTHTLHIIQKNQLLDELRDKLEGLVKDEKRDQKKQLRQLLNQVDQSFQNDQYWDDFRGIFEQVHQTFFDRLKEVGDGLTGNDLRLVALLKMNYNSADIATLLGVGQDSLRVMRYRLRKKLNLPAGESLTAFIQSL